MTSPLFTSVQIGGRQAPHRIVMAPMTRARSSQPGDVPNAMNARYYAQRASAALIVSEATQVSPQGKGYSFTPASTAPSSGGMAFGDSRGPRQRRPHIRAAVARRSDVASRFS